MRRTSRNFSRSNAMSRVAAARVESLRPPMACVLVVSALLLLVLLILGSTGAQ